MNSVSLETNALTTVLRSHHSRRHAGRSALLRVEHVGLLSVSVTKVVYIVKRSGKLAKRMQTCHLSIYLSIPFLC